LNVGKATLRLSPSVGGELYATDQTVEMYPCDPSTSLRVRNVGGGSAPVGTQVELFKIGSPTDVLVTTQLTEGPFGVVTFDALLEDGDYRYRVTTAPTSPAAVRPEWWGDGLFKVEGSATYHQFTRNTPYFVNGAGFSGCTTNYNIGNARTANSRFSLLVWKGEYDSSTAVRIDRTVAGNPSDSVTPTNAELQGLSGEVNFFVFLSDTTVPGFATDQPSVHRSCDLGSLLLVSLSDATSPPSVKVTMTRNGDPHANVPVTFTVKDAGDNPIGEATTILSDSSGVATLPKPSAATVNVSYNVTAAAPDSTSVTFPAEWPGDN